MNHRLWQLSLLALVIAGGCSSVKTPPEGAKKNASDEAKALLNEADEIELYSLKPDRDWQAQGGVLHHFPILGKTTLKGESRTVVVDAFMQSLHKEPGANCFNPRHALKAKKGRNSVVFLICYECNLIYVHFNGEEKESFQFSTGPAAAEVLNKVLSNARIPLPRE